jgi:(2R)-sulfolactate sulfo-lyase subunit alpha
MEGIVNERQAQPGSGMIVLLAHQEGDDVAVAVRAADQGDAPGAYLASGARFAILLRAPIPLGHKVALRDLAESERVIEYGVPIGLTRRSIAAGDLVHTHNLRSARWQSST